MLPPINETRGLRVISRFSRPQKGELKEEEDREKTDKNRARREKKSKKGAARMKRENINREKLFNKKNSGMGKNIVNRRLRQK